MEPVLVEPPPPREALGGGGCTRGWNTRHNLEDRDIVARGPPGPAPEGAAPSPGAPGASPAGPVPADILRQWEAWAKIPRHHLQDFAKRKLAELGRGGAAEAR